MTDLIGKAPDRGACPADALAIVRLAGRPRRRSRAARGSRCRTRSWNCGARCRCCRTSRARRRRQPDLSRPRRVSASRRPAAAAIWSRSCCRGSMRSRSRCASCAAGSTRRRTRCSGRAPSWASGSTTWRSRRRTRSADAAGRRPLPSAARRRRRPAAWRCCRRRLRSADRAVAAAQPPAGAGPAHAGTGDAGGQCRAGAARLSRRRSRRRARC